MFTVTRVFASPKLGLEAINRALGDIAFALVLLVRP